jgi:putative peptidoglycan lipid II flippase
MTSDATQPGEPGDSTEPSLARSSAVMAAGTVASRLLGFLRASILAGAVGIGVAADTFDVANTLPNQFYLLLAGGVLNAVLVPQITRAASHDDGGHEFVNRLLTLSFALMAVATVLVTALAPLLVRLYSQGWSDEAIALTTAFAFICLPQILFYGLYTLLGQVLNARGRFAAYMWAPALANVVGIGGLLWFRASFQKQPPVDAWTPEMVWILGGTATLGVAVQAVFLIIPLRRSGFRYRPVWGFRGVGLRTASRVALWTFAALAVSQLGFVVTSRVMTWANDQLDELGLVGAGKAAYSLAFLVFMLPHSLITLSLVTALFTRMSRAAHANRVGDVLADLGRGLRMPAVLLVPGTVAAVLLARQVAYVVFFSNSEAQTDAIAQVIVAMIIGIVPFGWLYLIQRVYYAYEDAKTPFSLQLVVTAVATAVNLLAFLGDPARAGIVVGLGQTLSNLAAAMVGFVLLRRRFGLLRLRSTIRVYVRLVLASLVAAAATWPVLAALGAVLPDGRAGALGELAVGGGLFMVLALGLAYAMRVPEVGQLLEPVLRRARRGSGPSSTP